MGVSLHHRLAVGEHIPLHSPTHASHIVTCARLISCFSQLIRGACSKDNSYTLHDPLDLITTKLNPPCVSTVEKAAVLRTFKKPNFILVHIESENPLQAQRDTTAALLNAQGSRTSSHHSQQDKIMIK